MCAFACVWHQGCNHNLFTANVGHGNRDLLLLAKRFNGTVSYDVRSMRSLIDDRRRGI